MREKKRIALLLGISLLAASVVSVLIYAAFHLQKWKDIARISRESYNGAFLAMYDISNYSEEDFATFRGIPTLKANYSLESWRDLSKYMTEIFSSQNTITNVYLGLDPAVLWEKSGKNDVKWAKNLDKYLVPYVSARQDVFFEILLPSPSLQYWTGMKEEQMEEKLEAYYRLIEDMGVFSNVKIYFFGGEKWLIANPENYVDDTRTNIQVSRNIFLHAFCDQDNQIVAENASSIFSGLIDQVGRENKTPTVYPDLSDWCIVFFGDSIIAKYNESYSIPGVVSGLTGAETYNCCESGIPASENSLGVLSFNRMVTRFLEQDTAGLNDDSNYSLGLTEYTGTSHEGKKVCFVVEFGLNDYFIGFAVDNPEDKYDTGTYAGALRTGIRTLQDAYPEAEILLLAPTYTAQFSGGTEINSEKGGVLTDYVSMALNVSDEMGVYCLNNYVESGINADTYGQYLTDGLHPDESGSFLLGNGIIDFFGRTMIDEQ